MKLKILCLVFLATGFSSSLPASAEPITASCADEDVIHPGWDSALSVSYSGGPTGEISVKSDHVDFIIPASMSERTTEIDGQQVSVIDINGSGEAALAMPDVADVFACVAASTQPEFKGDADMEAVSIMSCAPKAKLSAEGVRTAAVVRLGIWPGENGATDVIVEIKRRYVDVKTPTGADLVIDTFPKDCKLAVQ